MKAEELADCLMEHPDWDVEFYFLQFPDEIDLPFERIFSEINIGTEPERKTMIMWGNEND